MNDPLATWYQATNDGTGWKLEKKDQPTVGDYMHSEFRKEMSGKPDVETQICKFLGAYESTVKAAVCRVDRNGLTLDGWKHRTINLPVSATLRGRVPPRASAKVVSPNPIDHQRSQSPSTP